MSKQKNFGDRKKILSPTQRRESASLRETESNGVLYIRLSCYDKYSSAEKIAGAKCSQFPDAHTVSQTELHSKADKEPNYHEAATRCHRKSKIMSAHKSEIVSYRCFLWQILLLIMTHLFI